MELMVAHEWGKLPQWCATINLLFFDGINAGTWVGQIADTETQPENQKNETERWRHDNNTNEPKLGQMYANNQKNLNMETCDTIQAPLRVPWNSLGVPGGSRETP